MTASARKRTSPPRGDLASPIPLSLSESPLSQMKIEQEALSLGIDPQALVYCLRSKMKL
jgi:hypothetical protein